MIHQLFTSHPKYLFLSFLKCQCFCKCHLALGGWWSWIWEWENAVIKPTLIGLLLLDIWAPCKGCQWVCLLHVLALFCNVVITPGVNLLGSGVNLLDTYIACLAQKIQGFIFLGKLPFQTEIRVLLLTSGALAIHFLYSSQCFLWPIYPLLFSCHLVAHLHTHLQCTKQ